MSSTTEATPENHSDNPMVKLVTTTMATIKETMKTLITTTTEAAAATEGEIKSSTTTATLSSSSSTAAPSTSSSSFLPSSDDNEKILNVSDISSSLQHFGWVDYFVFVLMLVVCAVIGFYFGFIEKKQKNNKKSNMEQRRGSEALDYLVGGRKMKVFPVSLSLVAR